MAATNTLFSDNSIFSQSKIDGGIIEGATIPRTSYVGLEPAEESRSANYSFIKGPEEFSGKRVGFSSYLTSITSCVSSEAQQELTVDSISRVLIEVCKDLEKRKSLIRPRREDPKVDLHREKAFKITYKDQLNSIEFITDREEIKTISEIASSERDAEFKAKERLSSIATVLSSEFDHEVLARTHGGVAGAFRPVPAIDRVVVNFTAAI